MKKKVYVFLVALLLGMMAAAQSALYEVSGLSSNNSLVREWQQGIDVVFNQDGRNCFLLIDRVNNVVKEAEVSGLNSVADMEIEGDMVYFCGDYNNIQVLGYFDVSDLFNGTNQVQLLPMSAPQNGGNAGTLELTKLEVLSYNLADVHVFLLGDVQSVNADYTCLFNAYYDGVSWRCEAIYEQGGVFFMDDLAITQSNLVIVGNKYASIGDIYTWVALPQQGNPYLSTGGFLLMPFLSTAVQMYYPISRPLIETLSGDSFATASYGFFEGQDGVVVTLYSNHVTMTRRWFVSNMTNTKVFRDLRYDGATDRLFLMPDYYNTVNTDEIYVFDIGNDLVSLFQSDLPGLFSVDVAVGAQGAVVSGITQANEVGVWRIDVPDCECSRYITLPALETVHDMVFTQELSITVIQASLLDVVVAAIAEYDVNRFCGDE